MGRLEQDYLNRLITAVRAVVKAGRIDRDIFLAPAELGIELGVALRAYDGQTYEQDHDQQRGDEEG